MEDGAFFRPIPARLDGQILEEIAPPPEEGFGRGDAERLAETARAGDEEQLADRQVDERQQPARLVDDSVNHQAYPLTPVVCHAAQFVIIADTLLKPMPGFRHAHSSNARRHWQMAFPSCL